MARKAAKKSKARKPAAAAKPAKAAPAAEQTCSCGSGMKAKECCEM